jgi:N-acetylglucosaminyldiphosphoundecaprenol N-acetyl-beta-D-mannosaminyltransferase
MVMSRPKYICVFGFKVFNYDISTIKIDQKAKVINTISPNSYGISTKDKEFKEALEKTDYLVLDGVYFAIASLLLQRKNIKRNQGPDMFDYFMRMSEQLRKRVFFLGSSIHTLELIKANAAKIYPHVTIGTFSPPFKPEFNDEEAETIINAINSFRPEIVFVGMTCPKQEKWAIKYREKIDARLIITIGNVFDWFAGTQKPIKPIWYKLRLGWLIRIIIRPEIFKRNIGNQMIFLKEVIITFLRFKKCDYYQPQKNGIFTCAKCRCSFRSEY